MVSTKIISRFEEKRGLRNLLVGLKDEPSTMDMLQEASMYETQSEGELLSLCEPSKQVHNAVERKVKLEDTSEPTQAAKKSGRAKRKEKRLKNEPSSITGKQKKAPLH